MTATGFLYDDIYLQHKAPPGHPEREERLVHILDTLKRSPLWDSLIHFKPRLADFSDIALAHTEKHIEMMKNFGPGYLDPDTYMSANSFEAACFAAGAVIEAIELCKNKEISRAFCAVRPPGHHAEAGKGMGFCIFNNVAVGARYAQKIGYEKVFIIDFDVHHGNGTQHIFEEDDKVFYFSTHQYPHYPGTGDSSEKGKGRGAGFTYNVPMRYGSANKEYFNVYNDILPGLVRQFSPDILLVSAGYDLHQKDPLAAISISTEGIRNIVHSILTCADCPAVFTLEGGYDLSALAESVKVTVEELLKD